MDSRFRGNDDIRLAADIHGIAKLKWYHILDSFILLSRWLKERNFAIGSTAEASLVEFRRIGL